jgi:hypothetical protein
MKPTKARPADSLDAENKATWAGDGGIVLWGRGTSNKTTPGAAALGVVYVVA